MLTNVLIAYKHILYSCKKLCRQNKTRIRPELFLQYSLAMAKIYQHCFSQKSQKATIQAAMNTVSSILVTLSAPQCRHETIALIYSEINIVF